MLRVKKSYAYITFFCYVPALFLLYKLYFQRERKVEHSELRAPARKAKEKSNEQERENYEQTFNIRNRHWDIQCKSQNSEYCNKPGGRCRSAALTTVYSYDDSGRLISSASPNAGEHKTVYDAAGRPVLENSP